MTYFNEDDYDDVIPENEKDDEAVGWFEDGNGFPYDDYYYDETSYEDF